MRIILFTGKGGVGKTTTAAATALRLADRGTKTLLISTDAAHSVGDALAVPLGPEPSEVAVGLSALHLDTQQRLEAAWRDVQRYLLDLLSRSGVDPVTADELTMLPGIEEVLALLAVHDLASTGDWDAIVVDCAPTAETLRLLALPEALSWYIAKVFPSHRRMARGMRPFASLLGRGDSIPPDGVFAALLALNDELAALRALLVDPEVTTVRLVMTPESVVLAEARRTLTALALYGYQVDEVVANRIMPSGRDSWRQGWVSAQRAVLADARDSFSTQHLREVAYLGAEPIGVEALRAVGVILYGEDDPLTVHPTAAAIAVEAEATGYLLSVPLPLADRSEVEVARVGDDLVVGVGGRRRVLSLPSVLRRCTVVGGEFADGALRVHFAPDPAVWPRRPSDQGTP